MSASRIFPLRRGLDRPQQLRASDFLNTGPGVHEPTQPPRRTPPKPFGGCGCSFGLAVCNCRQACQLPEPKPRPRLQGRRPARSLPFRLRFVVALVGAALVFWVTR